MDITKRRGSKLLLLKQIGLGAGFGFLTALLAVAKMLPVKVQIRKDFFLNRNLSVGISLRIQMPAPETLEGD